MTEDSTGLPLAEQATLPAHGEIKSTSKFGFHDHHLEDLQRRLYELPYKEGDPVLKRDVSEVLSEGTYHGQEIGFGDAHRNAAHSLNERVWFADLAHRQPQVAQLLAEKGIAGFHATGSFVLADLVESGFLLSANKLAEANKPSITGAHDAKAGELDAVSFGTLNETTHNLDAFAGGSGVRTTEQVIEELAAQVKEVRGWAEEAPEESWPRKTYEKIAGNLQQALDGFRANPHTLAATLMRHSFPVAIGVKRDYVRQSEGQRTSGKLLTGQSHYGEFRPASEVIPLKELPVIAVPADQVGPMKKLFAMFKHEDIDIIAIEDLVGPKPY